ncbi:unnamed protein product, partial [Scytosiphon promiscuus]
ASLLPDSFSLIWHSCAPSRASPPPCSGADDTLVALSPPPAMVAGTRAEVPTNSYLRQFLSRATAAAVDEHQQHADTSTHDDGNGVSKREGGSPREGQRNGNPVGHRIQGETDDHDVVARYGHLPTPRSPPRRPCLQPPPLTVNTILDNGDGMMKGYSRADHSVHGTSTIAAEDGDCGDSSRRRACGTGGGRPKQQQQQQQQDDIIDEDGPSRLRTNIDATMRDGIAI